MGEPETFLSFEEWVKHIFDHEVRSPEWYWDEDAWEWNGPSELTINYLTRLFSQPLPLLANYSDEQLFQGFWYLVSTSCSNHTLAVIDDLVPLNLRVQCVLSMQNVFGQLFSELCLEHLSHNKDEAGAARWLNTVCYVWWDLMRDLFGFGESSTDGISRTALEVMEATLKLDSIACQEGALHGLGHWAYYYHTEVQEIIDKYLQNNPHLKREIKDYALRAREGDML